MTWDTLKVQDEARRAEVFESLRLREGEELRDRYRIEVLDSRGNRTAVPLSALSGLATNPYAVVSFVLALTGWAPLAVVFGHVALRQIDRRGEAGKRLAQVGLVVGYIGLAYWALVVVSGGWVLSQTLSVLDLPPVE